MVGVSVRVLFLGYCRFRFRFFLRWFYFRAVFDITIVVGCGFFLSFCWKEREFFFLKVVIKVLGLCFIWF